MPRSCQLTWFVGGSCELWGSISVSPSGVISPCVDILTLGGAHRDSPPNLRFSNSFILIAGGAHIRPPRELHQSGATHAMPLGEWDAPGSQSVRELADFCKLSSSLPFPHWMVHVSLLMHFLIYLANRTP